MQNVTLSCLAARAKIKHKLFSELICQHNYCRGMIGDHNKLWEILKEMRIPDHLTRLLRNLCRLELCDMEQQTGSKLGKVVYCHPASLISM